MAHYDALFWSQTVILCFILLFTSINCQSCGNCNAPAITFPVSFLFARPGCPTCPVNCPINPSITQTVNVLSVSTLGTNGPKISTYAVSYPNNNADTRIFFLGGGGGVGGVGGGLDQFTITFQSLGTEEGVDVISFYQSVGVGAPFVLLRSVSGSTVPGKFTTTSDTLCVAVIFRSNCQNPGSYSYTVCVGKTGC